MAGQYSLTISLRHRPHSSSPIIATCYYSISNHFYGPESIPNYSHHDFGNNKYIFFNFWLTWSNLNAHTARASASPPEYPICLQHLKKGIYVYENFRLQKWSQKHKLEVMSRCHSNSDLCADSCTKIWVRGLSHIRLSARNYQDTSGVIIVHTENCTWTTSYSSHTRIHSHIPHLYSSVMSRWKDTLTWKRANDTDL